MKNLTFCVNKTHSFAVLSGLSSCLSARTSKLAANKSQLLSLADPLLIESKGFCKRCPCV
jgi:hypothetical protein